MDMDAHERLREAACGSQICPDTVEDVKARPMKGDMLCFDGEEWRVACRGGWHFPVPDPDNSMIDQAERWP